jgi:hypothetical protein
MRYYCKSCETDILLKGNEVSVYCNGTLTTPEKFFDGLCPICDEEMENIPDYETPAQYEKRTGKAFPKDGLIWVSAWNRWHEEYQWESCTLERLNSQGWQIKFIVIADPPVPPPCNWKPDGES